MNLNEFNDIKVAYQGCAEGRYCYPKNDKKSLKSFKFLKYI